MSYEIVKNCRVCFDSETETYYAVLKTASNNCYPHYYSEWTYGKLPNKNEYAFKTKEEVEKALLIEFFNGNLQKGNSKYRRVAREIRKHPELLERYEQLNKEYHDTQVKLWRLENSDNARADEFDKKCHNLYLESTKELKDVLYNFMITHKEEVKTSTKVEPFTIKEKNSGCYVRKVTKTRYFTNYSREDKPTLFTSRTLWDRVTTSKWWQENFEIKQV